MDQGREEPGEMDTAVVLLVRRRCDTPSLYTLAYSMTNFLRTLALPDAIEKWSLTSLREKLVKIGARLVAHGRYMSFQMTVVAVQRDLFRRILQMIERLRPQRTARC